MAKASTKPNTQNQSAATDEQVDPKDVAATAIRAVTGCGVPESKKRVAAMTGAEVNAIAKAESSNQRDQVPALLAKATRPQPTKAPTPKA